MVLVRQGPIPDLLRPKVKDSNDEASSDVAEGPNKTRNKRETTSGKSGLSLGSPFAYKRNCRPYVNWT